MNGDRVRIAFYAKCKNREAEGEVIEILECANTNFVGTLEVSKALRISHNREPYTGQRYLYPKR